MLEKLFKLRKNGTDVKTEVLAGITTFMTMAYILAVNPSIMAEAGMNQGAVFTATALAALLGTLFMAFFANYPFRPGAGNGLECLLCLYGCAGNGIFLGNSPDRCFCRRPGIYCSFLTNVREAIFKCNSPEFKGSGKCGNRFIYRFYRSAECKNCHWGFYPFTVVFCRSL